MSLIGHDNLKAKLGLVANRIADAEIPQQLRMAVQESLLGLLSEQSSLSHPQMATSGAHLRELRPGHVDAADPGIVGVAGATEKIRRLLGERVVRITVKPFMDMSTMIEERLLQCCVHVGTRSDQDQCAPFCAVQAWPALGRQRLSIAAGQPLPLVAVEAGGINSTVSPTSMVTTSSAGLATKGIWSSP